MKYTASIQSTGLALSEWVDSQPEPYATLLRFLPLCAAAVLGALLVLLWKRKSGKESNRESGGNQPATQTSESSRAEEILPMIQEELKASLEKNQRQKEQIASARRTLEVKEQEIGNLQKELEASQAAADLPEDNEAEESTFDESSASSMEPREDLQEFAHASKKLAKAARHHQKHSTTKQAIADGGGGNEEEWSELLLFRSSDPSIWNESVNAGENHCAVPLNQVPANAAYLRLRRLDTGEGVLVPIAASDLGGDGGALPAGFNGSREEFYGASHLGIYSENVPQEVETRFGYGGWGFGHRVDGETAQACAWAGQEIDVDTVMEITVFPCLPDLAAEDQLIVSA